MSTERNLTIWMAAALNDTEAQNTLKSHWFGGNFTISNEWFANLTMWNSTIATMIGTVNGKLITANYFNLTSEITPLNMAAEQWAKG